MSESQPQSARAIQATMHYMEINWVPTAIAIGTAGLTVLLLRIGAWAALRRAHARTRVRIERVLREWEDDSNST